MTKYWTNDDGTLNQATDDSQDLSDSLTEVNVVPQSGKQVWNGSAWTDPNKVLIDKKRRSEYPSIVDQLDNIYHNGIDEWKKTIKAVKDKYPK
tara:strand:+ start:1099 stop:1377 length:279 start_codon:yes stop_codon:yes gene_type:complete